MPLFPGPAAFIENIIFHPCARPWFIYALTAIPAAIKAIATVRYIDLEDIMREGAKDFAHGPRKGTGRSARHSIRGLLQDDAGPRKHWAQKGVQHLLRATAPLEYLGFTALLLGAADRFFYDWQALLLAWRYCEGDPDSGPFQMERQADFVFVGSYQMDTLLQNRSGWSHNTVQVSLPPGNYFSCLSLNAGYHGLGTATINTFLRADLGLVFKTEKSDNLSLTAGQSGDMVVVNQFFLPFGGNLTWGLEGDPVPTGYTSTGGSVIVMRSDWAQPS